MEIDESPTPATPDIAPGASATWERLTPPERLRELWQDYLQIHGEPEDEIHELVVWGRFQLMLEDQKPEIAEAQHSHKYRAPSLRGAYGFQPSQRPKSKKGGGPVTLQLPCCQCESEEHTLKNCPIPDKDGWLRGCPKCNVKSHSYVGCEEASHTLPEVWHFLRQCRKKKRPLEHFEDWRDLPRPSNRTEAQAAQEMPWSAEYASSNRYYYQTEEGVRTESEGHRDPYWDPESDEAKQDPVRAQVCPNARVTRIVREGWYPMLLDTLRRQPPEPRHTPNQRSAPSRQGASQLFSNPNQGRPVYMTAQDQRRRPEFMRQQSTTEFERYLLSTMNTLASTIRDMNQQTMLARRDPFPNIQGWLGEFENQTIAPHDSQSQSRIPLDTQRPRSPVDHSRRGNRRDLSSQDLTRTLRDQSRDELNSQLGINNRLDGLRQSRDGGDHRNRSRSPDQSKLNSRPGYRDRSHLRHTRDDLNSRVGQFNSSRRDGRDGLDSRAGAKSSTSNSRGGQDDLDSRMGYFNSHAGALAPNSGGNQDDLNSRVGQFNSSRRDDRDDLNSQAGARSPTRNLRGDQDDLNSRVGYPRNSQQYGASRVQHNTVRRFGPDAYDSDTIQGEDYVSVLGGHGGEEQSQQRRLQRAQRDPNHDLMANHPRQSSQEPRRDQGRSSTQNNAMSPPASRANTRQDFRGRWYRCAEPGHLASKCKK